VSAMAVTLALVAAVLSAVCWATRDRPAVEAEIRAPYGEDTGVLDYTGARAELAGRHDHRRELVAAQVTAPVEVFPVGPAAILPAPHQPMDVLYQELVAKAQQGTRLVSRWEAAMLDFRTGGADRAVLIAEFDQEMARLLAGGPF
jgi:hypothetical protein